MGTWFRLIRPPSVHGMLTGIGILIVLAQVHVLMGSTPTASAVGNAADHHQPWPRWATIPDPQALTLMVAGRAAGDAGLGTVPPPQAGAAARRAGRRVATGTLVIMGIAGLPIPREDPRWTAGQYHALQPATALPAACIPTRRSPPSSSPSSPVPRRCIAAAVDKLHDGPPTDMNGTLGTGGIGNSLCGLFGGLPITGVIVRSSANVQAGAHAGLQHPARRLDPCTGGAGAAGPGLVPLTALAAVLLVTGWRLVNLTHVRELFSHHGPFPAGIWAATVVVILVEDLLLGVAVGPCPVADRDRAAPAPPLSATSREAEDAIDVT